MRALVAGFGRWFVMGVAWGAFARLFMRLISTSPEFSWVGTGMILAFAGLFWGLIGVVVAARAAGRTRWWRLAPVPGLILFSGAGLFLLPGAIAVGLALFVRDLRARLALVAVVSAGMYAVIKLLEDDTLLGPRTQTLGNVLIVVATVWAGAGFHLWWRRWTPDSTPATATGEGAVAASPAAYGIS
ncbi:hypothetical protein [Intrasporangium sp.]|jgi:hypothetical protein|uniref:hypothetical protein n=1 Tax=Intrasporangium sp. TaxID=1925024 RepID=UPI003365530E